MKWFRVNHREPVSARTHITINAATGGSHNIYAVPPDKLLVLEAVSVEITNEPNPDQQIRAMFEINFEPDDPSGPPDQPQHGEVYAIPLTKTTFSNRVGGPWTVFAGTQSLRLYVEDYVMIGFERDLNDHQTVFHGYISGYLVPRDSPTLHP